MKSKKQRPFWIYPVLFAIYPILALLATNLDQIRIETALHSVLISLAGGVILYLAAWLILRDLGKAALAAFLWLALFFSYGHIYQLIEGKSILGIVIGKHRYLMAAWALLLAVGTWGVLKGLKSTKEINQILTFATIVLLVFPAYQIGAFEYRFQQMEKNSTLAKTSAGSDAPADSSPDIYYIVLDGYSRSDVIQKLYNLDTTPFLNDLKSLGFVIPECAQSNYALTPFSIFASLNMDYLDSAGSAIPLGARYQRIDYQAMRDYLRHSKVRDFLAKQGYKMVAFETGTWWLDIDDADVYIIENNNPLKQFSKSYSLSNFEDLYIRTTALRVLTEAKTSLFPPITQNVITPSEQRYEWVKFALDELDKVPEIPGKKFVYFHILSPHDPYVFGADGSYQVYPSDTDMPGYPNAVTYLNSRIVEIVRNLIAKSKTPPVIILQGDHGWDPRYRMQILNAYYLPNGGTKEVYPTITPVNSFRLILDKYFGANYDLLPDTSYFSMGKDFPEYGVVSRPYQMTPEPIQCLGDLK